LDQFVVESEVVPDSECNLLTSVKNSTAAPTVSLGGAALSDFVADSPSAGRKRSGSSIKATRK
jgi:hypothetical protein